MKKTKVKNGYFYENEYVCVFFGNKNFNSCIGAFEKNIIFGKQVHESNITNVDGFLSNGSCTLLHPCDGLLTTSPNKKIGVYTADCIPCFIFSKSTLLSLHLGWRGIQRKLFEKAIEKIDPKEKIHIFIGPHILQGSFEVGIEVVEQISQTEDHSLKDWCRPSTPDKYLVSLKSLLEVKASRYNCEVHTLDLDTKTSPYLHSYRQSSGAKDRNISFAFLKD